MRHLKLVYDADAPRAVAPVPRAAVIAPPRRHNILTLSLAALALAASLAAGTIFDGAAEWLATHVQFSADKAEFAPGPAAPPDRDT